MQISIERDDLDAVRGLNRSQRGDWCVGLIEGAEDVAEAIDESWTEGRRGLCEFLGIGESTLSGWLKEGRMPRYAKLAWGQESLVEAFQKEVNRLDLSARNPKVVRVAEGHYQICRFAPDEDGVEVGRVMADHIPTFNDAIQMASALPALRLLQQAKDVVREMLDRTENPKYIAELERLDADSSELLLLAVDRQKWREWKQKRAERRREAALVRSVLAEIENSLDLNLDQAGAGSASQSAGEG